MFKSFRFIGSALLSVAIVAPVATAQTAPQLLPYTTKTVAGGGASTPASGGTCPVSGYKATDAYGDGCLATEVLLGTSATAPGPRDAIADAAGNVFFGDYANGIIHRVDAVTGILSAVAGSAAASPAAGATCGTTVSTDAKGDGCLSTLVHLSHPTGLVFSPAGDLYFSDYGYGEVRKVAATAGSIPAGGGIITLVAGSAAGTFGFTVSTPTAPIIAATQSILDGPFGLAFDTLGDLLFVDEYEAAAVAVNLNATGTTTPVNTPVPAGQIWKIAGTLTGSTGGYCNTGSGCTYNHTYTDGLQANLDYLRAAYGIAADPSGNVYITDEYYDTIQKVAPSGVLTTYAGINNTPGHTLTRGQAGTIAIGSPFGVTADSLGNIYFTDAYDGVIWRVDGATQSQYLIAQGFGTSGSGGFATATLPGPGILGISVDPYADLFFADTENNKVYEVASGSQFGPVGANQPIDILDIHFAKGDTPASNAYSITAGANNFALNGTATCTANSDGTTDCLLPVTATPTTLGLFTGTLTVKSTLGTTATFPLTGTYIQSPVTRVSVTHTTAVSCTGTTTFSSTTPVTITATLNANGPTPPNGTISFFANGTQITGSPVNVTTLGNGYGATITATFPVGTYTFTATYSGDTAAPIYFKGSSGTDATTLTTALPSFSLANTGFQQGTVKAGQTGLYSFTITQTVYSGTINFAVTGLPSNSSYTLNPTSITGVGCTTTSTVALSIITQAQTTVTAGSFAGGQGYSRVLSLTGGIALALLIGLRRRRLPARFGQLGMMLALLLMAGSTLGCGKAVGTVLQPATPTGTYNITVTPTATTGTAAPVTFTLIVQ